MDPIEEADALHARVRAFVADGRTDDATFKDLAAAIADFQARAIPGYRRLCAARGVDPARDPPRSLPAVPTDAFRLSHVATFPIERATAIFRTSGTTHGARGAHAVRDLRTYHDAAIAGARDTIFAPYRDRPLIFAIAPSLDEADGSSLGQMLAWFVDEIGARGSRFLRPDAPALAIEALEAVASAAATGGGGEPLVVMATAFAWVHLVDALGGRSVALPRGSRAMQTGGFKGRSREIPAAELRSEIAHALGLPAAQVVGEYGMTELGSQLWATPEVGSDDRRWLYRPPPWMRVVACDPVTLAPLPAGTRGIGRFEDLVNVESAWAIQTSDEIVVGEDGALEIFGRLSGATPRGCSLAIEELLER
jgi:hypothetical protein